MLWTFRVSAYLIWQIVISFSSFLPSILLTVCGGHFEDAFSVSVGSFTMDIRVLMMII